MQIFQRLIEGRGWTADKIPAYGVVVEMGRLSLRAGSRPQYLVRRSEICSGSATVYLNLAMRICFTFFHGHFSVAA